MGISIPIPMTFPLRRGAGCYLGVVMRAFLGSYTPAYYADFATPFHVPLLHRSAVG